tara:strand:+ start:1998 stop:2162 length:165 start_codon:yes stop_codon:yes gene_type:complete
LGDGVYGGGLRSIRVVRAVFANSGEKCLMMAGTRTAFLLIRAKHIVKFGSNGLR